MCNELDSWNVFIVVDFNVPTEITCLAPCCIVSAQKIGLSRSDEIMFLAESFTYVNDAYRLCSWLDHYVSCLGAHDSSHKIEVLHQFIPSVHTPVAVTITRIDKIHDLKKKSKNWIFFIKSDFLI